MTISAFFVSVWFRCAWTTPRFFMGIQKGALTLSWKRSTLPVPFFESKNTSPGLDVRREKASLAFGWWPLSQTQIDTRYLGIPLWMPCICSIIATTLLYRFRYRALPIGVCRVCGYDLTGNVSGICPECGEPI